MSEYLQAVSSQGYLIHAVPAAADRIGGNCGIFSYGRPLCGKVKGRSAWAMPNMRVKRVDGSDIPFTQDLRYVDHACKDCLSTHWVVTQQSE